MKIEKYLKKNKDKVTILLDNGEVLDTYDDVIVENKLFEGTIINEIVYNKILEETKIQEKYNECVKYIKARLRSEKEIREYLIKKNTDIKCIDIIVDKLIKKGLINDDFFCKCFINDKLKFTSQGDYRIKQDLKKSGIDDNIIDKYDYLFDKELLEKKMDKLIDKYIKASKNKSSNYLKNKIYNNLMVQGYDIDMILTKLNVFNFEE